MTVSANSANFNWSIYVADSTPDLAMPSAVTSGATCIVGVINRTDDTTDCTGVSDSINGAYTKASETTPTTGSALWYFNNSAAGTPTVTATWAGAINSQMAVGWVLSDAGAMTFGSAATVREAGGNETAVNSNTVAPSGAGCIVGFASANNAQSDPEPTANGTGESELLTGGAGLRMGMFFEAFASGGTYGFETTWDSARTDFHVASFLEGATLDPIRLIWRQ